MKKGNIPLKLVITALCLLAVILGGVLPYNGAQTVHAGMGDRITISNNQFMAGGTRIWLNGANTPWNSWDDFGGYFDYNWWNSHFKSLHDNGINVTRVWIVCSGDVGININSDGSVTGATSAHWSNLDSLFEIARNNQVYVMPTLMSFDSFEDGHNNTGRWRNWINNTSNIDTYVNNYLIPFVKRYNSNPYVFAVDLINEPDWSVERGRTNWGQMQQYFARAAKAVHDNSNILVTVGIGVIKHNSKTVPGAVDNFVSDSALQAKVNSPNARLDFWSPHYYNWMDPYWPVPFYTTPGNYGLETSKPAIIGETPAGGSGGNGTPQNTTTNDFENAYKNGWQGVMPWTSNGVDAAGNMNTLGPATRAFRDNHYNLVFPSGSSTSPTATRPAPTATKPAATSAAPTATPVSSGSTQTIFGDSTSWDNWSWAGTYNFSNSSPVYSGSKSIAVTYQAWGGLTLHKEPAVSTAGYTHLSFWAHGGASGTRQVRLNIESSGTSAGPAIDLDIPAGKWTQFNVALSSLGNLGSIYRINLQDRTGAGQPVFYIDDVRLVGSSPAPTATKVPPTATKVPPTATKAPVTATPVQPTTTKVYLPTAVNQATATPIVTNSLSIYGDSTSWDNWSWSGTYSFSNTSPVYSGSRSIAVTYGSWGGLSLHKEPVVSTSGYTNLTFWAHGGSSGTRQIKVYVHKTSSTTGTEVNVDIPAGKWTQFSIPLSSLGNPTSIYRITFQSRISSSQPKFYLDQITLSK